MKNAGLNFNDIKVLPDLILHLLTGKPYRETSVKGFDSYRMTQQCRFVFHADAQKIFATLFSYLVPPPTNQLLQNSPSNYNTLYFAGAFVHLIHGVDSEKLLREIDKQALKNNRIINCLLQIHIAKEETKFGLDEAELKFLLNNIASLTNIHIDGLMGMASFSDDMSVVRNELKYLRSLFDQHKKHSNQ